MAGEGSCYDTTWLHLQWAIHYGPHQLNPFCIIWTNDRTKFDLCDIYQSICQNQRLSRSSLLGIWPIRRENWNEQTRFWNPAGDWFLSAPTSSIITRIRPTGEPIQPSIMLKLRNLAARIKTLTVISSFTLVKQDRTDRSSQHALVRVSDQYYGIMRGGTKNSFQYLLMHPLGGNHHHSAHASVLTPLFTRAFRVLLEVVVSLACEPTRMLPIRN